MSTTTPTLTATPAQQTRTPASTSEAVKVKEVGAGAIAAPDPFRNWLPRFDDEDAYNQTYPKRDAKAGQASGVAEKLIARAKQFVGTPYKWGGNGPLGFDCSGFTQFLYREIGINLPRVSYQQANVGKRISLDQLRPGDLVFWDNSSRNNGADHVAIYIGNGMVIHAPKPGDRVKISKLWDTGRAWGVAMNL